MKMVKVPSKLETQQVWTVFSKNQIQIWFILRMEKLICQQKQINKVIQILDNLISIYIRKSYMKSILMEMWHLQATWTIFMVTSKGPWNIFPLQYFKNRRLLQFINLETWSPIEVMWPVERECWTYRWPTKKVVRSLNNIENIPIVQVRRYPWSKVGRVWRNIIGWYINKFKKTKPK
jgi:hypothetical protein